MAATVTGVVVLVRVAVFVAVVAVAGVVVILFVVVFVVVAPGDREVLAGAEAFQVGGDEVFDPPQAGRVVGFNAQHEGVRFGAHGAPALVEVESGGRVRPFDVPHPRVRVVRTYVVVQAPACVAADGFGMPAQLCQIPVRVLSWDVGFGGRHVLSSPLC